MSARSMKMGLAEKQPRRLHEEADAQAEREVEMARGEEVDRAATMRKGSRRADCERAAPGTVPAGCGRRSCWRAARGAAGTVPEQRAQGALRPRGHSALGQQRRCKSKEAKRAVEHDTTKHQTGRAPETGRAPGGHGPPTASPCAHNTPPNPTGKRRIARRDAQEETKLKKTIGQKKRRGGREKNRR
jgi:hypothetical protein